MVNYAWVGPSQGKPWWKFVAILTCKSFVKPGHRGERLIEPFSSWFPPKFPSGLLKLDFHDDESKREEKQLHLVKLMIRSLGKIIFSQLILKLSIGAICAPGFLTEPRPFFL